MNAFADLAAISACWDDSPFAFCLLRVPQPTDVGGQVQVLYLNDALRTLLPQTVQDEALLLAGPLPAGFFHSMELLQAIAFEGETCEHGFFEPHSQKALTVHCRRMGPGLCGCLLTDGGGVKELTAETQEQLHLYRTAPNAGVYRVRLDEYFTLLYGNDRYYQIVEYTPQQLSGLFENHCCAYTHPADLPVTRKLIDEARAEGRREINWVMRILTGTGSLRYVRTSGVLLDGGMLEGTILDVTEELAIKAELQDAKTRMENIINAIPGGVAIYRVSDIFETVYFSDGVPALTGYTPAEYRELIRGGDAAAMTHPLDTARVVREVLGALAENRTADLEFRKLHRDGSIVWVHMQGMRIGEDDGCPLLQCVFHNITKQQNIQLELLEKTAVYDIAIRNSQLSIWKYDAATKTVYQTPQSMAFHPTLPSVMPHFMDYMLHSDYIKPESREVYQELYQKIEQGAPSATADIWFASPGGGWWCERMVLTSVFGTDGELLHAIGAGWNVTRQIELNIRAEQLELALASTSMQLWTYDLRTGVFASDSGRAGAGKLFADQKNGWRAVLESGVLHEDSHPAFAELHQALERGEKTASALLHCAAGHGAPEWMRVTYSTIFDEDKQPIVGVAVGEDVTELVHAKKLFDDELRYQAALRRDDLLAKSRSNLTQNRVESYISKDHFGVAYNGMCYSDSVVSMADAGLLPEEQQNILEHLDRERLLTAFAAGVTDDSFTYQRRAKSGDVRWVNTSLRLYQDPESGDVKSFLYSFDVHQKKTMQRIIDQVVDVYYELLALYDLSTNLVTTYSSKNPVSTLIVGQSIPFSEALGSVLGSNMSAAERQVLLTAMSAETIRNELAVKSCYSCSFTVPDKTGANRRKKWDFSYLDRAQEIVLFTRTDVTELFEGQAHQQQLLRAALAQAEQASLAKTEFLSRMSHEIRTPMNAIIGMSTLAAQCVNDPQQVSDCLSKVGISARFLLSLINDILDMSRIESGKVVVKQEKIPFESFLQGVNTLVYELASKKGVEYDCIVASFTQPAYLGDAMKLQQVLVNILSNAIKFTEPGGKVQLLVAQTRVDGGRAHLRFTVNDTGVGISEDFLPHLFDPFEQEHTGTTNPYGGTGLGLAICKNLVGMMGGSISVNSIAGVGSEFVVDVALSFCEDLDYDESCPTSWSNLYALIVDDEVMICEQTHQILSEMGTRAEWVDSGVKAVELVRDKAGRGEHFDLVLVDWKMPGMDGIETARQIRQIVGPDVTIIIMTAYDWGSIETQAKQAGVNLLVSKPLFRASLCSAFEKIYHQKEQRTAGEAPIVYDFTGLRALLVEDHILNVEVARRLLTAKGMQVEVAENGLRAIECFATAPVGYYDVILMDIRMPLMDGLTATRSIRQLRKSTAKSIPIIAMSANAFDEDVEKSKLAGMNAHLAKPIEPQLLYSTLHHFIKGGAEK